MAKDHTDADEEEWILFFWVNLLIEFSFVKIKKYVLRRSNKYLINKIQKAMIYGD